MELTTSIQTVVPLNPKQKEGLKKLHIETVRDFLYFFPSRYNDVSIVRTINELLEDGHATIYGKLSGLVMKKSFRGKMPMARAKLTDLKGSTIEIVWFHQPYIAKQFANDMNVKLVGAVSKKDSHFLMTNPRIEETVELPIDVHDSLFGGQSESDVGYPLYRESRGLTSTWIFYTIKKILGSGLLDTLEDPLPEYIRTRYHLPSLSTALIWLHMPKKKNDALSARKRFAFEEVFFVQLHQQKERLLFLKHESCNIPSREEDILSFTSQFPFSLTGAQKRAIDSITNDMCSGNPMSRLLEGDVGSGKTAVAATVAYLVAKTRPKNQSFGNLQVAYMAPTEVLATQLFEDFISFFKDHPLPIILMTGSTCKKFPSKIDGERSTDISKNQAKKWIAEGVIPMVVGTHALIQKTMEFKNLGLVIIDEQHRFGTNQRGMLVRKDNKVPHLLSMTATPIPRTLALTIYGDLDLSVLNELPKGRKPPRTEVVLPTDRKRVYDHVRLLLEQGRQVYVICPRIDVVDPTLENSLQLASVEEVLRELQDSLFTDYTIDALHSKLPKLKKEKVMKDFVEGRTNILVSTSVVEVGINVPNATCMIIEGAERFGLSQLHQLRGRIVRSSYEPFCYLFADVKSEKTERRLQALVKSNNGFELAEADLMERGAGDLAGRKQWGLSDLAMEALRNVEMVEAARTSVRELLIHDPDFMSHPEIARHLKHLGDPLHLE